MKTEYKTCMCGHSILVYIIKYDRSAQPQAIFFDAATENYEQVFICPNCNERLEYSNLGD
jgi:transcription initiation factor IIE alpha subunit